MVSQMGGSAGKFIYVTLYAIRNYWYVANGTLPSYKFYLDGIQFPRSIRVKNHIKDLWWFPSDRNTEEGEKPRPRRPL